MPFKKGQSGNPAGRPRGSRSKFSQYKQQVAAAMPEILASLVEQAKDGDTTAARVLLARMWPETAMEIEGMEQLITELNARITEIQGGRSE